MDQHAARGLSYLPRTICETEPSIKAQVEVARRHRFKLLGFEIIGEIPELGETSCIFRTRVVSFLQEDRATYEASLLHLRGRAQRIRLWYADQPDGESHPVEMEIDGVPFANVEFLQGTERSLAELSFPEACYVYPDEQYREDMAAYRSLKRSSLRKGLIKPRSPEDRKAIRDRANKVTVVLDLDVSRLRIYLPYQFQFPFINLMEAVYKY